MQRALVIKGADFSDNKIGTISYNVIHATSITLDEHTLNYNSIGSTAQLSYTVTPSNAEDAVRWASSDGDVAVVDRYGNITVTGCGECTITVMAGSVSDECDITVHVALDAKKFLRSRISSHTASSILTDCSTTLGSTTMTYSGQYTWCDSESTFSGKLMCCSTMCKKNANNEYEMPDPSTYTGNTSRVYENIGYPNPIILPDNAKKIICEAPNNHYGVYPLFFNHAIRSNDLITSNGYFQPQRKQETTDTDYTYTYSSHIEIVVPIGYDSVVLVWKSESSDYDFTNLTEQQLAQFTAVCA